MTYYPGKIAECLDSLQHAGYSDEADAIGAAAKFDCGSVVRVAVSIDGSGRVASARFATSGCGFAAAAAEIICRFVTGRALAELGGLDDHSLKRRIGEELGQFGGERLPCLEAAAAAVRRAFADYREKRLNEFRGEKPLVCTCFGVTEDAVAEAINKFQLTEVEEVAWQTRAGAGCGSCRLIIRELLDAAETERLR